MSLLMPRKPEGDVFRTPPFWPEPVVIGTRPPADRHDRAGARVPTDTVLSRAARELDWILGELESGSATDNDWPDLVEGVIRKILTKNREGSPSASERDSFNDAFGVFARARIREAREIQAHKRIARERADLTETLDTFADIAASASDPDAADFALRQGESAIRNRLDDGFLDSREAVARLNDWRRDLDERRALNFIRDDPAAAGDELSRQHGNGFAALPADRRRFLAGAAADREATARVDGEEAAAVAEDALKLAAMRDRERFAAVFSADLRAGTARAVDISEARTQGLVDDAMAVRLKGDLARIRADRAARMARIASVGERLDGGDTLDPEDREDAAAAEAWVAALLGVSQSVDEPGADLAAAALDVARDDAEAVKMFRYARNRLGFLPPSVDRTLDLYWRSGEPRLMRIAAEAGPRNDPVRGEFLSLLSAGMDPEAVRDLVRMREENSQEVQVATGPASASMHPE